MNDFENYKVSIIIPVYNREEYLDRCISSMINQTFSNIEIILINDGSTDGSADICDSYAKKDSRIIVIHKPNGGVSSARNAGLEIMTGDYLCFCDSDDFFAPEMVEKTLKQILAENADMCTCNNYRNLEKHDRIYDPISLDLNNFDSGKFFADYIERLQAPYSASMSLYNAELVKRYCIRFSDFSRAFF